VSSTDHPIFHELINLVGKKTGFPIVLNTSLNGPGAPIIERPFEAFEFFLNNTVDCAWIDGVLFAKPAPFSNTGSSGIDTSIFSQSLEGTNASDLDGLKDRLNLIFPDLLPWERRLLSLSREFLGWMEANRKKTTIRYKKGAVEYPLAETLPMYMTSRYEAVNVESTPCLGVANIATVTYKAFGDLNETDSQRDGFYTLTHLRSALSEIYGTIGDEEIVTIYDISFRRT
jgi:hypothetical protein